MHPLDNPKNSSAAILTLLFWFDHYFDCPGFLAFFQ